MRLALEIAPQHSTQYADMTARLAEPELLASPAGEWIEEAGPMTLGGRPYVVARLRDGTTVEALAPTLSRLGASRGIFELVDGVPGHDGPLLRPVEPAFTPHLPRELAEARRYKGKTSEVFTRVLLNVALFGGAFRERLDERLRILDPLAGGGTTPFVALSAGYDAFAIELVRKSVETTAVFVREFCRESRIPHRETLDRKGPRRARYELGPRDDQRVLLLIEGDSRHAPELLRDAPGGARMHAVVADLPYSIQHAGDVGDLLGEALPAWESVLVPGGTVALAWDATRLPRAAVVATVERETSLRVLDGPYAALAHRVDRVIKQRDVVVAVKPA